MYSNCTNGVREEGPNEESRHGHAANEKRKVKQKKTD